MNDLLLYVFVSDSVFYRQFGKKSRERTGTDNAWTFTNFFKIA